MMTNVSKVEISLSGHPQVLHVSTIIVPQSSSKLLYTIKIIKSENHKGIPNPTFLFDDEEIQTQKSHELILG